MTRKQKEYLRREIRRSARRCRRGMRGNARAYEREQERLATLWEIRQAMRKMEVTK